MGCTGIGAWVAVTLADRGHSTHILDTRVESFDRIPTAKIESGGIEPVVGDGTSQRDLLKVSIQDADVFMALSESDTMNALASEVARSVFQVPAIVTKIDDPDIQDTYNELGVAAIGATQLISDMVLEAALV